MLNEHSLIPPLLYLDEWHYRGAIVRDQHIYHSNCYNDAEKVDYLTSLTKKSL